MFETKCNDVRITNLQKKFSSLKHILKTVYTATALFLGLRKVWIINISRLIQIGYMKLRVFQSRNSFDCLLSSLCHFTWIPTVLQQYSNRSLYLTHNILLRRISWTTVHGVDKFNTKYVFGPSTKM